MVLHLPLQPPVTNTSLRQNLGLNQQIYHRLKLSMELNLRRQIFVAVCDDLNLRDQLAAQLETDINEAAPDSRLSYPHLVSLQLNLEDPNPLIQIAQWLTQFPPPIVAGQRTTMPAFQILGVEHLTRQSPAAQRLFFTHLQTIEHNLPLLDSGLLIWVNRPWFYTLPQSAPVFWRCRTGTFEFLGDPTPLTLPSPERIRTPSLQLEALGHSPSSPASSRTGATVLDRPTSPSDRPQSVPISTTSLPSSALAASRATPVTPSPAPSADLTDRDNPWLQLAENLAQLYEADTESVPAAVAEAAAVVASPVQTLGVEVQDAESQDAESQDAESQDIVDSGIDEEAIVRALLADSLTDAASPAEAGDIAEADSPELEEALDFESLGLVVPASEPVVLDSPDAPPAIAATGGTQTTEASTAHQTEPAPNPLPANETGSIPAAPAASPDSSLSAPSQPTIPPLRLPKEWIADEQVVALLQQIEQLHQQPTGAMALATAYRLLGNRYRDRIELGEVTLPNLIVAIQAYDHMLNYLPDRSPLWVDILNDIGNLYWMLARLMTNSLDALPYLQHSIRAYQMALEKIDQTTQSHTIPMVQNNLGAAYADLARYHEPVENLQRSIDAYRHALQYRKAESDPQRYASTQNNLGTTYWNLAQYKEAEVNLKRAIAAYSEALRLYSPDREPLNYAMIQNNLGTAYWNLSQHERPYDWLMLAISSYRMALKYRTSEAAPAAYAATQNNLGTAYWHIANQSTSAADRLHYLQQAVETYEAALQAVTALLPQVALNFDRFATNNNLGLAHYQIATDAAFDLDSVTRSQQLQAALTHHLRALNGWDGQENLRQTALNGVAQTVRAFYHHLGLPGQTMALSMLPGTLVAEILPKLS